MSNMVDDAVLEKIRAGDAAAFKLLVYTYQNKIFNLVHKLISRREDAEEVTQDIFIKIYKSIHTFRKEAQLSTWIYRIAYNAALNHLKKSKKQVHTTDMNGVLKEASSEITHTDNTFETQAMQMLYQAIMQLPTQEKTIILLYYYEDCTIKELGKILGLSTANIKVKLHRIRKKLKKVKHKQAFYEPIK